MDADEFTDHIALSDIPATVIEQARQHPGGSVAQLDAGMLPDPNGYAPGEAVIGAYEVGQDGVPTGVFRRNPRHGHPIVDEWSKLDNPDHWFGWLPDSPSASVRRELEGAVAGQIPGTVVEWVKVLSDPVLLTGGPRRPDNPEQVTVRRAGFALEFAMSVLPPSGRREFLVGAFTWVATGLDGDQRRDRTWFDVGMPIAEAGSLLDTRIWELDAPTASDPS
jgi:hypothetical protein